MEIEEQVLSIEQMKHLKELGLKVGDTALSWYNLYGSKYNPWKLSFDLVSKEAWPKIHFIPTLTLQEILEILPEKIIFPYTKKINCYAYLQTHSYYEGAEISYHSDERGCVHRERGETIKETSYNMLCWVLENKYF